MKLLTLNCHSWLEEEQLYKIKYLAKTIVEEKYDVIALQEASQSIKASIKEGNLKEDNYGLVLIEEIKKLGGEEYHLVWDYSHIGYDIYEEGLCILTKHKVVNSESFYISKSHSKTFWRSRKIVKATIDINNENIDFILVTWDGGMIKRKASHFRLKTYLHMLRKAKIEPSLWGISIIMPF